MGIKTKWIHGSNISTDSLDTGTIIFDSSDKLIKLKTDSEVEIYGEPDIKEIINVTWSELKALRDANTLVPGQYYRITDYVTTTNGKSETCSSPNSETPVEGQSRSAGHQFDIIVRADSASVLNENAKAAIHDGDTYFVRKYGPYAGQTVPVSAWKLKYCLDNDITKYEWADTTNGKGVIYQMIDERDNNFGYDYKNIQFYRADVPNTYSEIYNLGELQQHYSDNPTTLTGAKFQFNTGWYYTFGYIRSDITTSITPDDIEDSTVVFGNGVSDNFHPFTGTLSDIVEWSRNFWSNTFGAFCSNLTFFEMSYFHQNDIKYAISSQFASSMYCDYSTVLDSLIYSKQSLLGLSSTSAISDGISYSRFKMIVGSKIRCSIRRSQIEDSLKDVFEVTSDSAYVALFTQEGIMQNNTFSLPGTMQATTISGFFTNNTITGKQSNNLYSGTVGYCEIPQVQTSSFLGMVLYCKFPKLNTCTFNKCGYTNFISDNTGTISDMHVTRVVGSASNYINLSTYPNLTSLNIPKTFGVDASGRIVGSYMDGATIKGYYLESATATEWKELTASEDWKRKTVETAESDVTLAANTITLLTGTSLTSLSISLPTEASTDGQEYILQYSKDNLDESCTISFDSTIKWANGSYVPSPSVMKDNAVIQVCIVNGCATWAQYYEIS